MPNYLLEDDGTTEETQSNAGDAQGTEQQQAAPAQGDGQQQQNTEGAEAGAEQAEGGASGDQQQAEPTIEIDGKAVPVSKVKQALQDSENDQSWKDKNRRESEQLNAERERLRRAALLEEELARRPEVMQMLYSQTPPRNFDAEIADHYSKRPDEYADPGVRTAWEMKRDALQAEKIQAANAAQIETIAAKKEADAHNDRIFVSAKEKYVTAKKVAEHEFDDMTKWIIGNLNIRAGKAPENAYEVAYRTLYGDRWERDIRADAVKRTTEPIRKATNGGADAGHTQRTPLPSQADADDNEFVSRTKQQSKGNYVQLS